MSYSSLATQYIPASNSNYTQGRRGYNVCKITPHHMAGKLTAAQCGNIFANPSREASSNYGIGYDGEIACYVDEENRAWTSGSRSNDCQAITIEVSNDMYGEPWTISEASWNSLVNLCVDICKRYGFRLNYDGTPNGSLTRHDMFQATNCPGQTLGGRFPELVETVNKILDGEQPSPSPEPGGGDEPVRRYCNGSTREICYSNWQCTNQIGYLSPYEQCDCFGEFNGRAMIRYKVDGKNDYKLAFCKWVNGIQ